MTVRRSTYLLEAGIKINGDRTIEDWNVAVYNDTDFKLRNAFERWSNGINNMTDNEG